MNRDALSISMVSAECESAIGDEDDVTEMLRKSFKAAKHHWMVLDQDPQLKGALNAVLTKMGEDHPQRERLITEIQLLAKFNAFLAAASSGLSVEPPEVPENYEPFGVMRLWSEAA